MDTMVLAEKIYKRIQETELSEGENRFKDKSFRISELCLCSRKSFYYRKHKDIKLTKNAFMYNGIWFHDKMPELLKGIEEFDKVEYEKPCLYKGDGFKITGRCDAVTDDTLYEFKFTMSSPSSPKVNYYYPQANAYANMLGVPNYKIIMVSSKDFTVNVLIGNTDKLAWEMMIDSAKEVNDALINNEDGKNIHGPKYQWECQYCPFRDECPETAIKRRIAK